MEVIDLLSLDRVDTGVALTSKKRVLERASTLLASAPGQPDEREIFESLCARERLGSTGLGGGVAIPHGRVQSGDTVSGAFIRLAEAVDFDAPDQEPVDILFALVVPEHFTDQHLELLAQLAQIFRDQSFCERIRNTNDSAEILGLLAGRQAEHA